MGLLDRGSVGTHRSCERLTGTKVVRIDIATGSGTLGGIAIGGNKVYWTEADRR